MKAAILLAPQHIELRDIAQAEPAVGELLVRVRVALTDGTDLKAYRRGHPKMPMPTRFGHEFSGDVIATGAGVHDFAPGDAIACVHTAPCGECYWCTQAQEELCSRLMRTMLLGAYAETIIVPAHIVARNLFHKPENLAYEAAAFLEPLACVTHAWDALRIQPESCVAIVGNGGFGLLHAMVAKALGVREPLIIGRNQERLDLARTLHLGRVVDTKTEDPLTVIRECSEGRGADIVIECTGAREIWELAPSLARRGGTVVLFGGLPTGEVVAFDAQRLHYDEITLRSPFHLTPRSVRRAFDFLTSHQIDPRPLISARRPLHELGPAFADLLSGKGVKVAILP